MDEDDDFDSDPSGAAVAWGCIMFIFALGVFVGAMTTFLGLSFTGQLR